MIITTNLKYKLIKLTFNIIKQVHLHKSHKFKSYTEIRQCNKLQESSPPQALKFVWYAVKQID